jgi:hypothetical protein
MKKSLWILAGVGLILAATSVAALADEKMDMKATGGAAAAEKPAAEKAAAPAEASFTGEVLDLTCYASHPETGSGEAHASCAKTCLEKGLPVGLLVGDKAYLVVMKDHTAPNKTFASYAGQKVTVKGIAKDVSGTQILTVTQFTPPTEAAKK